MVSNHTLGLIVNIILHVLILLIFLTILFFTVIVKKEKDELNSEIDAAINSGVNLVLGNINTLIPSTERPVVWSTISEEMEKIKLENASPNTEVESHNSSIFYNSIILIIMLCVIMVFSTIYINLVKKRKIGLRYIIIENFFIFLFVGSIEFIFFWYIVQNYIPIYPEDAEIEMLEHMKSYFS